MFCMKAVIRTETCQEKLASYWPSASLFVIQLNPKSYVHAGRIIFPTHYYINKYLTMDILTTGKQESANNKHYAKLAG